MQVRMCRRVSKSVSAAPPNPRNVLFLSRLMMPWRCVMCGVICLPCLPTLPALPALLAAVRAGQHAVYPAPGPAGPPWTPSLGPLPLLDRSCGAATPQCCSARGRAISGAIR